MSDDRTPEQRLADEALVRAIEGVAQAYDMIDEGWALGDWLVGVEFQPFAQDLIGRERYGHITPYPTIPSHRVLGLLNRTTKDVEEGSE